jgi:hypothetical protein
LSEEFKFEILQSYLNNYNFKLNLATKYLNEKKDEKVRKIINKKFTEQSKSKKNLNFMNIIKLSQLRLALSTRFSYKFDFTKKPSLKDFSSELNLFFKVILEAKKFIEANNSELIFIYLPSREFYDENISFEYNQIKNNSKFKEKILNFLNKENVKFIDLTHELLSVSDDVLSLYPFKIYSHLNKAGQAKVANILARKILK